MTDKLLSTLSALVKGATGIRDISLFRKRWHKRLGRLIYHHTYTARDLVALMAQMGMRAGDTVCIHASMMEFYNFRGTAEELIQTLLDFLGPEGTLVMPAFPRVADEEWATYVFDPLTAPTAAGYLAETFRRWPGVMRSNNAHHSVCAIGPQADYLLRDHTRGHNCWDEHSPWYRLAELDAKVFNLGMPRNYIGTICHCVEGTLYHQYPYWAQFFTRRQRYRYRREGVVHEYDEWVGRLTRRTREKNIFIHFTSAEWQVRQLSNLEVKVFYAHAALAKMIALGRRGVTQFYVPSPRGWQFTD